MKDGFRQAMAWLHTWVGLVLGWLLFAIFATGTATFFHHEITTWMQPEIHAVEVDPDRASIAALRWLQAEVPGAHEWSITPPTPRHPLTEVFWEMEEGVEPAPGVETFMHLDGEGRPAHARDTRGGEFLYAFHYELHYLDPLAGRWIVGIAAMLMLVALISGIITHKKIFTDFFVLRLGKGQRSWLDAHNVSGVLILPFFLMITYTGLVIFGATYMPWAVRANFADEEAYSEVAFPNTDHLEPAGRAVPLAPLGPMLEQAHIRFGGGAIGGIAISNPGDANASLEISASTRDQIAIDTDSLMFEGTSGRLLRGPFTLGGGVRTEGFLFGLHMGQFADLTLRWLYFLSGLAGAGAIATGLVLWTVKRRAKLPDPARPHFGFRMVEKLNIATIAGFPASIAVYFLANRVLPVGLTNRAESEIAAMFIAWGGFALWAAARPARAGWRELLFAGAVLFSAIPLASALTTDRPLTVSIAAGDMLFVGFEGMMLVLAAVFGWAGYRAGRPRQAAPVRRAGVNAAEAQAA